MIAQLCGAAQRMAPETVDAALRALSVTEEDYLGLAVLLPLAMLRDEWWVSRAVGALGCVTPRRLRASVEVFRGLSEELLKAVEAGHCALGASRLADVMRALAVYRATEYGHTVSPLHTLAVRELLCVNLHKKCIILYS